jgi:hypothetical protein
MSCCYGCRCLSWYHFRSTQSIRFSSVEIHPHRYSPPHACICPTMSKCVVVLLPATCIREVLNAPHLLLQEGCGLVDHMVKLCKQCLCEPAKPRDAAAYLLARIVTRPDMEVRCLCMRDSSSTCWHSKHEHRRRHTGGAQPCKILFCVCRIATIIS